MASTPDGSRQDLIEVIPRKHDVILSAVFNTIHDINTTEASQNQQANIQAANEYFYTQQELEL